MISVKIPKVFISYSWDDPRHKEWVCNLATRLRRDGVDVILDQWHTSPGDHLPTFMMRSIQNSNYVLIICTRKYKVKSERIGRGAHYEGCIIQSEAFTKGNQRKFIPVLRKGRWTDVAPLTFLGTFYIDLRDRTDYQNNYRELLLTLLGRRKKAPDIGKPPRLERIR
jgi:hypothetical protein